MGGVTRALREPLGQWEQKREFMNQPRPGGQPIGVSRRGGTVFD